MPNPSPYDIIHDSELFAAVVLKVMTKKKRLVPFKWNAVQQDFHKNRTGRDIILKARQLGFSTYAQGEMFHRAVTSTRSTITLAHDDETTTKMRLISERFWNNCLLGGVQPLRRYANASLTTYPEFDSEMAITTAGNPEAGRGGTYTDFHGSEVAFWKDAEGLVSGALQGGNPDVILESTPNGAQGYFYKLCMEALRGEGVWKLHFYPWWWEPTYKLRLAFGEALEYTDEEFSLVQKNNLTQEQIKWRRYKQKELKEFFIQEYPEDPISCFLTSGNSYFGRTDDFFTAPLYPTYKSEHEYFAGLDFGQTNDFTAMPVIDRTTLQLVDLLHVNKLEWKDQRTRIKAMYHKWHCKLMVAEWNSIGGPNVEELQRDGIVLTPFKTTNFSKSEVMAGLYEALHTDGLRLQDIPAIRQEMNAFISKQSNTGLWRLEAKSGEHDDIIMALALAWAACSRGISFADLEKIKNDTIDYSNIPEDMLEAARMSGIDIEELMRIQNGEFGDDYSQMS